MDKFEINRRIDAISAGVKSAECLNALHACRLDHPWNKTAKTPWQNACFMVNARPYHERPGSRDLDWLAEKARAERETDQ